MRLKKLLAEPLTHFVLLGGALFVAYRLLNPDAMQAPTRIVVPQAQVEALVRQHELTWQRRPNEKELDAMTDSWVEDEILFREGLAAGADRNDPVVRRRVVQKMQYLFEDMAADVPTEADLEAWFHTHRSRYRIVPAYSLEQVFLGNLPAGDAEDAAARALATLQEVGPASVGVASLLPARVEKAGADRVAQVFGQEFVQGLQDLPVGVWKGPLRSAYGSHLVRLTQRQPGRDANLAEVRQQVVDDVQRDRREKVRQALFDSLRERYTVEIEGGVPMDALAASTPAPAAPSHAASGAGKVAP